MSMPGAESPALTAVLRIEKAGRKGKVVTLIEKLPKAEHWLDRLARKLKVRCGSGGTYRWNATGGVIEIQGDKRATIKQILEAEERIRCRG
jgi:translation initiation factor 1